MRLREKDPGFHAGGLVTEPNTPGHLIGHAEYTGGCLNAGLGGEVQV
jgi:hypothetical protein